MTDDEALVERVALALRKHIEDSDGTPLNHRGHERERVVDVFGSPGVDGIRGVHGEVDFKELARVAIAIIRAEVAQKHPHRVNTHPVFEGPYPDGWP